MCVIGLFFAAILLAANIAQHKKSSHSRNCESLIIGSDIHVYTYVTPIMEFTLLGLSFEVHLRIALKQCKIADF